MQWPSHGLLDNLYIFFLQKLRALILIQDAVHCLPLKSPTQPFNQKRYEKMVWSFNFQPTSKGHYNHPTHHPTHHHPTQLRRKPPRDLHEIRHCRPQGHCDQNPRADDRGAAWKSGCMVLPPVPLINLEPKWGPGCFDGSSGLVLEGSNLQK